MKNKKTINLVSRKDIFQVIKLQTKEKNIDISNDNFKTYLRGYLKIVLEEIMHTKEDEIERLRGDSEYDKAHTELIKLFDYLKLLGKGKIFTQLLEKLLPKYKAKLTICKIEKQKKELNKVINFLSEEIEYCKELNRSRNSPNNPQANKKGSAKQNKINRYKIYTETYRHYSDSEKMTHQKSLKATASKHSVSEKTVERALNSV